MKKDFCSYNVIDMKPAVAVKRSWISELLLTFLFTSLGLIPLLPLIINDL